MKRITFLFLIAVACISMQAQTVKTNARFVRGATMAFGRMTVSGISSTQIAERGFCYSTEKAEPTVDDNCTTKTLTNNGAIYWLKDLTPASKYYMRAYVKTKSGDAYYGDVIKFYTIPKGKITWNFHNRGDAATEKRISDAVNAACNYFNNMTCVVKTFDVTYSPGTPTADCNFQQQPWMNVGANASYQRTGTIMHEMEHGLGVIPYSTQWSGSILRSGNGTGDWLGDRVTEALRFWDNDSKAVLHGDNQHMWPYGINGASEDNGSEVLYLGNAMLCQALGEDGLEHNDNHFADPYYAFNQEDNVKYYLKNEDAERGFYTSYLVEEANGTLAWKEIAQDELATNDKAAWYVTFTPENQFYQFRNAATGHYISLNGSAIKAVAGAADDTDFHVMRSRLDINGEAGLRGYWLLHHAARNPRGMAAAAGGKVNTETFDLRNTATTQRWLILTLDEANAAGDAALKAFKQQANDLVARLKTLMAVPHREDSEGIDAQTASTIDEIEEKAASATSIDVLEEYISTLESAQLDFLSNVTPTDVSNPFDLTWMLQNPGFDSADGWSQVPALSYSCGEFYEKTFDMYQILKNMPAGTYVVKAQAFQRPGSSADAWTYFNSNQTSKITTFLYAGSKSVRVKNICADAQKKKLGVGTEVAVGSSPTMYVPNNMQAVSNYFKKGFYENELTTTVSRDGGSMKLGIRCSSYESKYWSIFDNFRVYFFGSLSADEVTDIENVQLSNSQLAKDADAWYSLDGRRLVGKPTKRGIYLHRGVKVVIK